MTSDEMNLENLPEHILKEIFLYVRNVKTLRLVSKYFKQIVDYSEELSGRLTLNISKIAKDSCFFVDSIYKKIIIKDLKAIHLNILHNYKWKGFITDITFETKNKIILLRSFMLLRTILEDFRKIEYIHIEFSEFEYQESGVNSKSRDELFQRFGVIKTEFPALKKLILWNVGNILYLFLNSPNLKLLHSYGQDITEYHNEVTWKLEELGIDTHEADKTPDENFEQFLENQSQSLKILEIGYANSLNTVTRKLYNLEVLRFNEYFCDFDNERLISNDKLKELSLDGVIMDSQSLEKILSHYKYIQKLELKLFHEMIFSKKLVLPNLRDLSFCAKSPEFLSQLIMKNLKFLFLWSQTDLNFIKNLPVDCTKNIEKLRIDGVNYAEISSILEYFPSLKELVLLSDDDVTESVLFDIISAAKNLTSIFVDDFYWKLKETPIDFLSKCNNDKLIIKFFQ